MCRITLLNSENFKRKRNIVSNGVFYADFKYVNIFSVSLPVIEKIMRLFLV